MPHIHAFGGVAAHALYLVVRVAGGAPHNDYCVSADDKLFEVQRDTPYSYSYAHLGRPLAEAANLIPSTN